MKKTRLFVSVAAVIMALAVVCSCVPEYGPSNTTMTTSKTTTSSTTTKTSTTKSTSSTTKTTSSTTKSTTTTSNTTSQVEDPDWEWTWFDYDSIMVTKYKGTSSKVKVPSKINGTEVKAVGSWTFRENTKLEEVVIPDSVTHIKQNLFMNCINLKKVTFPTRVVEFGDQIFEGCTSIQRVAVPYGVTELVYREFAGCSELEEVVLPAVTKIDEAVFAGDTKLKKIYYRGSQEQWLNIEKGGNAFPKDINYEVIFNYKGN